MTRDSRGRMLTEILAFPDNTLEYLHDWVQWLFPLPETSPFNSGAPVIDFATACAFRRSAALRAELRHSFLRMLAFYGFREDREGVVRIDALRWYRQAANWWMSMDHNHLRITRIIRCLRVLGLEKEAEAFFEALRRASGRYGSGPGARSFMFWERAATRPLVLAPEEE
ncbi:opioid growth factor receptor conserved region-domain-containing protein, partial [Sphaerosporella brunnea]